MARTTDPSKLERVKKATMELIGYHGYIGTSINAIAKKAGVSTGYLYRHYSSKFELVDELVETMIDAFQRLVQLNIENNNTARDIIYSSIKFMFDISINEPIYAKFLSVLVFDYSAEIIEKKEGFCYITDMDKNLLTIGRNNNEFGEKVTDYEIKLIFIPIVFNYISINLSSTHNKDSFSDDAANRLTDLIMNALR